MSDASLANARCHALLQVAVFVPRTMSVSYSWPPVRPRFAQGLAYGNSKAIPSIAFSCDQPLHTDALQLSSMTTMMMSQAALNAVTFKSAVGSRQAFLPCRAPVATPARQLRVLAAKIPGLKSKNNIAKVMGSVSTILALATACFDKSIPLCTVKSWIACCAPWSGDLGGCATVVLILVSCVLPYHFSCVLGLYCSAKHACSSAVSAAPSA